LTPVLNSQPVGYNTYTKLQWLLYSGKSNTLGEIP